MSAVTLHFEQDGETLEYTLEPPVTIRVQGAPPLGDDSNTITLQNPSLTFAGDVPWRGVQMTVTIEQLNVRHDTSTQRDPAGHVVEGQELVVSDSTTQTGKIIWRQVYQPAELAGKWAAERYAEWVYLVPSAEYKSPAERERLAADTPDTADSADSAAVSVDAVVTAAAVETGTDAPAPLTGRFQLVEREGPYGSYTALAIDGDASPTMGVNVRELAYFGTPQWQWTREHWVASYAKAAKNMNMKWVRFFTAHTAYTTDKIVARVKKVLDVLAEHNLVAVVCFADSLSEKGMFPAGDEQWHTGSRGHLIKDYFNNGNYRDNYLPLVKRIVTEFKDHPGVGMWQLMNELAIYNPPATDADVAGFAGFVDEVSAAIYQMDSVHPISIGLINTAHIMPPGNDVRAFAEAFYSQRNTIHAVTCHCYQHDDVANPGSLWEHEQNCAVDAEVANALGRAMAWTEFGAAKDGNRKASAERFLAQHLVQGPASFALQWGFMLDLEGIPDSGIGDGRYGFSKTINTHYDQLMNLFKTIARDA